MYSNISTVIIIFNYQIRMLSFKCFNWILSRVCFLRNTIWLLLITSETFYPQIIIVHGSYLQPSRCGREINQSVWQIEIIPLDITNYPRRSVTRSEWQHLNSQSLGGRQNNNKIVVATVPPTAGYDVDDARLWNSVSSWKTLRRTLKGSGPIIIYFNWRNLNVATNTILICERLKPMTECRRASTRRRRRRRGKNTSHVIYITI